MSTPASRAPLRLGLAGLGTVGIGVVKIVQEHAALIAARAGRPVVITAVSARDRTKNRDADLSGYAWETDPVALAHREDVDVFIEVMGGHEGAARDATEAAIATGKDVVSANKALLAHHGQALALAA
jgi:homoserine dehydrogenase